MINTLEEDDLRAWYRKPDRVPELSIQDFELDDDVLPEICNQRLVHMLVGRGYAETKTLCGMRVPALWDDVGLDTGKLAEFSADVADVTCESCRIFSRWPESRAMLSESHGRVHLRGIQVAGVE